MTHVVPAQGRVMEWEEYIEVITRHGREERLAKLRSLRAATYAKKEVSQARR